MELNKVTVNTKQNETDLSRNLDIYYDNKEY